MLESALERDLKLQLFEPNRLGHAGNHAIVAALGEALDDILTVAHHHDATRFAAEGAQCTEHRQEFHSLIGGAGFAATVAHLTTWSQRPRPSTGARVARACPVGVHHAITCSVAK